MDYLQTLADALKKKHHHYETRLDMEDHNSPDYPHLFGQTLYYKGQIELINHLLEVRPDPKPTPILESAS